MTNVDDFSILLGDFLEDAAGRLDSVESALLELENCAAETSPGADPLNLILGHFHTLKGNAGMMGIDSLQQFIHKLESILKPAAGGDSAVTASLLELCYNAANILRSALERLKEKPDAPLDLSDETVFLECASPGCAAELPAFAPPRSERSGVAGITGRPATIKVNFEKLDELLDLAGELVIHRNALASLDKRLKQTVSDNCLLEAFRETSELLGKTADNLRDAVMKARMLPLGPVFRRFTRLVRDLSRSHGKEMNLVLDGEDTEVDKTIIDVIGEPLLHLIRNSIDHGIEEPDERKKSGKPPAATLKLGACHESGSIVITVADDGRGICAGRIRDAAAAKGLLSEAEARALSDPDALRLVFLPGFSTSSELTETSGRGIGLDVVSKSVASLNGAVDLTSTPGKGTSFIIKLPLTLAIIQALMVEVSGTIIAIPLSAVSENIIIDSSRLRRVAAGEIIRLRGRLLPLVRLELFFGFEALPARGEVCVVIIAGGEKRCGLIVDRLLGREEIVIKAMHDYPEAMPGISGAAVLGDGRISFVLDANAIIGKSMGGGNDGRD